MKAIYLDAFSGISGNMMLGALIQAGVPASWLEEKLRELPLGADEFALRAEEVRRNGICSVYVKVALPESAAHRPGHHEHEAHVHRTMKDIRQMIDQAGLPSRVRENALTVFQAIAEAEAELENPEIVSDYQAMLELSKKLEELKAKNEELFLEWSTLSEKLGE